MQDLLEEQADSGRQRSSGVRAQATRGQAESHRRNWGQVNVLTGDGGRQSKPMVEAELAVPSIPGLVWGQGPRPWQEPAEGALSEADRSEPEG